MTSQEDVKDVMKRKIAVTERWIPHEVLQEYAVLQATRV